VATTQSKPEEQLGHTLLEDQLAELDPEAPEEHPVAAPTAAEPSQLAHGADVPDSTLLPTPQVRLNQEGLGDARQPGDTAARDGRNDPTSLQCSDTRASDTDRAERPEKPDDRLSDATDQEAESQQYALPLSSSVPQQEAHQHSVGIVGQTEVSDLYLTQKLREWHQPTDGAVNHDPLSLKQLQQELRWTQSAVQRTMTNVFGRKPFTVYKQKCKDKTICDFLGGLAFYEEAPDCALPLVCQRKI
jgi:hypothetical protein